MNDILYDDLRDWLNQAEKLNEVRHVTGANWESEIGLVTEIVSKEDTSPCVIFDEVPGCPKGFRVLVNMFGGKRKNMTFGFPENISKWELSDRYRTSFLENQKTIEHEYVEWGPILENILEGDDIDITKFPTPIWHEKDGGRYIGTGTFSITKDPEENWFNAGAYRSQIHNKNTLGIAIAKGHHGLTHRQKYWKNNNPMPIVMVFGGDPLSFFYAGMEAPHGVFELDLVGGVRDRPVKMVRGKTGLPIPANAEIAIEGYIYPNKTMIEGPFAEWTGHYANGAAPMPVVDIIAIYHRDDPILVGVPPIGGGADEMSRYRSVLRSAAIKQNMISAGVPEVQKVWCHEIGGARMLTAVSIRQMYPGHAVQASHIAAQCGASVYSSKYVIVTDEDVDVTDINKTLWAVLMRTDPSNSIEFIRGSWNSGSDPAFPPDKRASGDFTHSVALINACKPYHWKNKFPETSLPDEKKIEQVREKFGWILDKTII